MRSSSCSDPRARARRRSCAASPASSASRAGPSTSASAWSPTGTAHLPPERRNVSMVFQDYALWPHLSARDNVAFALKRRKIARPEARRDRRRRCWSASGSAASPPATRPSCPAGSSSGWPSPGRSSPTPGSCSATSRSPTSTPTCASGCGSRSPPSCARPGRRPSTSPTTRQRRSRSPTGSACWRRAGSSSSGPPRTSTPGRSRPSSPASRDWQASWPSGCGRCRPVQAVGSRWSR